MSWRRKSKEVRRHEESKRDFSDSALDLRILSRHGCGNACLCYCLKWWASIFLSFSPVFPSCRMVLWVWVCDPQLHKHMAVIDRSSSGVADDASKRFNVSLEFDSVRISHWEWTTLFNCWCHHIHLKELLDQLCKIHVCEHWRDTELIHSYCRQC